MSEKSVSPENNALHCPPSLIAKWNDEKEGANGDILMQE